MLTSKQNINVLGSLHKLTKQNTTNGWLLLRDRKKVNTSILFQNFCLGWKLLSPIRGMMGGGGAEGGWNKNILCGKNRKINLRGQRLLGAQEYIFPANCRKLNVF